MAVLKHMTLAALIQLTLNKSSSLFGQKRALMWHRLILEKGALHLLLPVGHSLMLVLMEQKLQPQITNVSSVRISQLQLQMS